MFPSSRNLLDFMTKNCADSAVPMKPLIFHSWGVSITTFLNTCKYLCEIETLCDMRNIIILLCRFIKKVVKNLLKLFL